MPSQNQAGSPLLTTYATLAGAARHTHVAITHPCWFALPLLQWASRRSRSPVSTVKSYPESARTRPSRYFQSILARTACAAWRSVRFSANCNTDTKASCPGATGTATDAERRPEDLVVEQRAERVPHPHRQATLRKRRPRDHLGRLGDLLTRARSHRHSTTPSRDRRASPD
ncbi:hypothetical protein TNCT6_70910 [Streptomyces sp. 6-11-2]|nr:hypothetical protein TNCT6_70910 [Streptomyces sp. 6-11-2]